jgi:transposase
MLLRGRRLDMAPRQFTPEFKRRVVEEFEAGAKGATAVCREYGICDSVLRRWVAQYREHGGGAWQGHDPRVVGLHDAEKRIAELEAALGRATLEVDFLKRCFKRANLPLP